MKRLLRIVQTHAFLSCSVFLLAFLSVFQFLFVTSGDTWAEAYLEYLTKAIGSGWHSVIASSWEGYSTVLPSFFSKFYYAAGLSLGYIDYYYRWVTILFAVGAAAFTAAPFNRTLIASDRVRYLFALAAIMMLYHPSSFSFINVWYIGFLPVILVSLNQSKLTTGKQVTYSVYAVLVAFTKPSVVLAPFALYRAIRTKEWVSNGIIFVAALVQTYLTLFASISDRSVAMGIGTILKAIYLGGPVAVLKLLSIPPNGFLVAVINTIIVGLFAYIFYRRKWALSALLAFGYLFSIYANLLAPDSNAGGVPAAALYLNDYKLQRWFLTSVFIGLLLLFAWDLFYSQVLVKTKRRVRVGAALAAVLVLFMLYHPIDTKSSAVYADFSQFRYSLSIKQPTCLPVAPFPTWSPGSNWYLQYGGGCSMMNFDKTIDQTSFTRSLGKPAELQIAGQNLGAIKTLIVLVKNTDAPAAKLYLQDMATGDTKVAVAGVGADGFRFVPFNLTGLPDLDHYEFTLTADSADVLLGTFQGTTEPTVYTYYMGIPIN